MTSHSRGGAAFAEHANDPLAAAYFDSSAFFRMASYATRYSRWLLLLVALSPLIQWLRGRPGDDDR